MGSSAATATHGRVDAAVPPATTGARAIRYAVLDPTGNVTALVEDPVAVLLQPSVAAAIMRENPDVEQVGFVGAEAAPGAMTTLAADTVSGATPATGTDTMSGVAPAPGATTGSDRAAPSAGGAPATGPGIAAHAVHASDPRPTDTRLRMAGGEFCGNASLSAAALHLLRIADLAAGRGGAARGAGLLRRVVLRVSGARRPVEVRMRAVGAGEFLGEVQMPPALGIDEVELAWEGLAGRATLVRMEGISHLVVEAGTPLFALDGDRRAAERAVRAWCGELGAACLGLMFLSGTGPGRSLVPLVFVPASGTTFWEGSCASGSAAVAMALAHRAHAPVEVTLAEPSGRLRATCDPRTGDSWLHGRVRLVRRGVLVASA